MQRIGLEGEGQFVPTGTRSLLSAARGRESGVTRRTRWHGPTEIRYLLEFGVDVVMRARRTALGSTWGVCFSEHAPEHRLNGAFRSDSRARP